MMQHLLRRLVFDIPLLNEHAKMPLKVNLVFFFQNMQFMSLVLIFWRRTMAVILLSHVVILHHS